jgi:quercetin dioxygenase-like cupin family protein
VISANRALPLAIDVDEVRRIDVPVTLICGRHDRLAPIGHTRRVSAELGWPLAVIDKAGHLPHLEQPRLFAAALRSAIDPDHLADLSSVAVARFTVQPGAQFPWHSHAGPVLVTVTEGELVYVMADGCAERSYPAGTAFLDPGRGHVHSAYNPTDGETVIVATFTEAPADGPLSITEGITAPADNCGLPTTPPS